MKFLLLLFFTVMFLWSCGDSTNDIPHVYENVDTEDAHANVSPVPESTEAFRQTSEKDTEESLADMTEIEGLLDTWAERYQATGIHYSDNTHKLLMLARMLLTNDTLTASEKMDIIREHTKKQLVLRHGSDILTNDYRIRWSMYQTTPWPYATYGALYLVLEDITNDARADDITIADAQVLLASINRSFYKSDQASTLLSNALKTYINHNITDKTQWSLDRLYSCQRSISDDTARLKILHSTRNMIKDNAICDMKLGQFTIELAHAYLKKEDYANAHVEISKVQPIDKENPDLTNVERGFNARIRTILRHIEAKEPLPQRTGSGGWACPTIDEIPNIRIDWRTYMHDESRTFHAYFRGLLDELMEKETGLLQK